MRTLKNYIIIESNIENIKKKINAGLINFEDLFNNFCENIDNEIKTKYVDYLKLNADKQIINKINENPIKTDDEFIYNYYLVSNNYDSEMSLNFLNDILSCSCISKNDFKKNFK